jgi:hypothetical protein
MDAIPDPPPTVSTPVPAPGSVSAPGVSAPARSRRTVYVVAGAVVAVLILAAAAVWALWLYDSGPSLALDRVEGVQVAVDGWQDLDLDGPLRDEVDAFVSAASTSRALWPPDLMFP